AHAVNSDVAIPGSQNNNGHMSGGVPTQQMRGQGWCHDNCSAVNSNCMVLESLVSARSRRDRYDGDLLASICVDAVHRAVESETGNEPCGTAVDILSTYYFANVVFTTSGLSRR